MNNMRSFFEGKRTIFIAGIVIIIIAAVSLIILLEKEKLNVSRERHERSLAAKAGPQVFVTAAKRLPGGRSITLTGEARPYASVTLYAKVSGYIKSIPVDKGDHLKEGQVVAVIESPELDSQYKAALADAQNKRQDAVRAKSQLEKNAISIQDAQRAFAAADQAEANTEALRIQKDYQIIRAPFPCVVTARFVDPGALVQSAVTSQTTTLPVASIAETHRIRVYVYLDQRDASVVRIGDRAVITDPSRPDLRLTASVSRMSGQLDDKTRTLLTEIDVDNRRGLLLAGSFVQVSLFLQMQPAVEIPAGALLIKNDKYLVAVVTAESKVNFRQVTVAESDAIRVRLAAGLEEGERVILNPGWGISEGDQIQPAALAAR